MAPEKDTISEPEGITNWGAYDDSITRLRDMEYPMLRGALLPNYLSSRPFISSN